MCLGNVEILSCMDCRDPPFPLTKGGGKMMDVGLVLRVRDSGIL